MTGPLWLLTSVGRPQACADVLQACADMGMTHPGIVWADGEDYRDVPLPLNWDLVNSPTNQGIGPVMNHVFHANRDASHFGWLADDTYPRTEAFDVLLVAAAGDHGVAYAHDGGYRSHAGYHTTLEKGAELTAGIVWAGELLRAAGWWALPGLRQAYVDVVWCELMVALNLPRYTPTVVVEHRQWRNGKRGKDWWDAQADTADTPICIADKVVYDAWARKGRAATIRKVGRTVKEAAVA